MNSPYKKISQEAQNVFDKHCPEKPGPIISVTGYIDKWLAVTRLRFYVVPQISWLPWTGSKIPLFGKSYATAFSFIRHPGATTTAPGSKPAQHGQTHSGKCAKTPRVEKYETILRDLLFSAPNRIPHVSKVTDDQLVSSTMLFLQPLIGIQDIKYSNRLTQKTVLRHAW